VHAERVGAKVVIGVIALLAELAEERLLQGGRAQDRRLPAVEHMSPDPDHVGRRNLPAGEGFHRMILAGNLCRALNSERDENPLTAKVAIALARHGFDDEPEKSIG
jgi:hypothetical protein